MNIKKIEKYQTSDGRTFDTPNEAMSHESSLTDQKTILEKNFSSIEYYTKTTRNKYVPIKYFDIIERFDFIRLDEEFNDYELLLEGSSLRHFQFSLEIVPDNEVAPLLYYRILKSGYETILEIGEFQELIEILMNEDWCGTLHKDDVLQILGAIQVNPVYIYE